MPTLGRKLVNIAQKARGRKALRYEVEVIPYYVGDVPDNVSKVIFCWERGTKLFVTDAEAVNKKTHAVFFKQFLKQVATIYMDADGSMEPKEYSFKIQAVKQLPGGEDDEGEAQRKTIGKVKVDVAQFCDGQTNPQPQELLLQCKPVGKLKVSIKASWLPDAEIEDDAMTEMTQLTEMSVTTAGKTDSKSRSKRNNGRRHHHDHGDEEGEEGNSNEQDLSGFEHTRVSGNGADYLDDGDGQGSDGEQGGGGGGRHSRRHGSNGHSGGRGGRGHHRQRQDLPEELKEDYELPADPDEIARIKRDFSYADDKDAEAAYRREMAAKQQQGPAGGGRRLHKAGWRDYVCCCCGPRGGAAGGSTAADEAAAGGGAHDPQEKDQLLSVKQAEALDLQNNHEPVEHRTKRKKRRKKKPQDPYQQREQRHIASIPEQGEGDQEEEQ